MSKWVGLILVIVALGITGYFFWPRRLVSPLANVQFTEKSLEKYDFDNLAKYYEEIVGAGLVPAQIEILGNIEAVEKRRTKKYNFATKEIRFMSDGKNISGMMNMPIGRATTRVAHTPVVIMIRGYASAKQSSDGYYPGYGTWKVADELAKQGYATISLDFLGYGNSDSDSTDVLEARFHKVIEVLDLIQSVKQLPWVDKNKIGIWAHSNGGQIALSVLEITGEKYPTVLWAPMTQPFPQSIIETADPGEEKEKAVAFVNLFNKYYDSRRYAFENYYEWISAPILIQQGTADTQVKVEWQQSLQSRLKEFGKKSELIIYSGADHNLKGSWQEAVNKDIEFYGLIN